MNEINRMGKVYSTDGIDSFISLHGFAEATRIVVTALGITIDQAKERVEYAQKYRKDEI